MRIFGFPVHMKRMFTRFSDRKVESMVIEIISVVASKGVGTD